jgi:hypothetical protein
MSDHGHDPFHSLDGSFPDIFHNQHPSLPDAAFDPLHDPFPSAAQEQFTYQHPTSDQMHLTHLYSYDGSFEHPAYFSSYLNERSLEHASFAYVHFDPLSDALGIIGDPANDMVVWHQQAYSDTCAVVAQEFIIDSLTGEHVSEDSLIGEALDHGWYVPGGGTPLYHLGDLLQDHGIHIEKEHEATLADIAEKLRHHQKIIVGVNEEDIKYHQAPNDLLSSYPGIPGQRADHAVEVIGIVNTDPIHPMVILNDPAISGGCGIEVPADIFEYAWSSSNCFMLSTTYVDPFTSSSRELENQPI